MIVKYLLTSSIKRMRKTENLLRLLDETTLDVCLICQEERWLLSLNGEMISISPYENEKSEVTISGENEAMAVLFRGDDFLLSLRKRGELTVTGRLRHLLLLESLWYLSKDLKSS
ncbi:hypothetical protein CR205_15335 [Alteribacter lacisalsi]|uniref:SCP2 domain-containing protein n=1 Tax=Alteribacter lacisalsi TaxID=2045244 RepID=A0A2W0H1U3_9BACI|nr:hypothetical protein [Alteribacter lacisalsi]PYZ95763.1 hypothetical protein CR205_15335 [Alteribacter lacisalsi]